jgi:hypothetical protein
VRNMALVASDYRAYSDTDWPKPYGGMEPAIWQYTDNELYNGYHIDMNAFKGSVGEYAALIYGNSSSTVEENMHVMLKPGQTEYFSCNGMGTLALATDFSDVTKVRVALWRTTSGWEVHDGVTVGSQVQPSKFSLNGVQKGSIVMSPDAKNSISVDTY